MRTTMLLGSALAALGLTVASLAGDAVPGRFLDTSAASAATLRAFGDCEELRSWYVDEALPQVGPYGLQDWWAMPLMQPAEATVDRATGSGMPGVVDGSGSPRDAVTSSGTGTNVQEVGVDEPDRAKTDGSVVVHTRGRQLLVTDVTGDEARELGRLTLPPELADAELFLHRDAEGVRTVLVIAGQSGLGRPVPLPLMDSWDSTDRPVGPRLPVAGSRLLQVSLADPAQPVVVADLDFGADLVSARQYGDTVRVVVHTSDPALDFVFPSRNRTEAEARQMNKDIVRRSTIEDWLPTVRRDGGDPEPLVDCSEVLHPQSGAGLGTTAVLTMAADDPAAFASTAVTAAGRLTYSSTDRLYLATQSHRANTDVHAFALEGADTSYIASGRVPGHVRDRWSFDERNGVLRVAVGYGSRWSPSENGVVTLAERGQELEVLGTLRGLGPQEEIKSVRWFDDLAVVVTFRQIDPLYTVDLTDPSRPRALGELKIPGFSSYLHPIGGNQLLGVGQDAALTGQVRGAQLSLFDIADLGDPQRVDTLTLGRGTVTGAEQDPRAFTWLPADRDTSLLGTAVTTLTSPRTAATELVAIAVSPDGVEQTRRWAVPRSVWVAEARALPLGEGRLALVGQDVRVTEL